MEKSSRNLLVGLGASVAVGSVVFSASNKVMAKIEVSANRQKAKRFVQDRLKGNKKALDVVEKLSDEQVTNILKVVDKASSLKERVGPHTSHLKNATNKLKDKVK